MSTLQFVKSNKGKQKLVICGYIFHLEKKENKIFRWCCENKKSHKCKSRVITIIDDVNNHTIKKEPSAHNHDPLAYKSIIYSSNSELKCSAENSAQTPSQIITASVINCEESCRSYLPSKRAQKHKIKRIRDKILVQKEPSSLTEICILEEIKYVECEQFVLCDKTFNDSKIIILGTINNVKLLASSNIWFIDGTFKVVPTIMRQLVSIHAKINTEIVPLVYCIMSNKSKTAYCSGSSRIFINPERYQKVIICKHNHNTHPITTYPFHARNPTPCPATNPPMYLKRSRLATISRCI